MAANNYRTWSQVAETLVNRIKTYSALTLITNMKHRRFRKGTFLYKLFNALLKHGMLKVQAYAVMDLFINGEKDSSMAQRWLDDPEGYPEVIYNLQWRLLTTYALKYVDEYAPKAWYRPVFLSPAEQEKWLAENGAK